MELWLHLSESVANALLLTAVLVATALCLAYIARLRGVELFARKEDRDAL